MKGSNHLWEADIKYGNVEGEDRFFFVMSIIDVFDRGIIAYHMGLSCDVKQTLKRAILKRQQFDKLEKSVIRTDNGPQFISHTFEEFCEKSKIEHERIPPRRSNMNTYIESFHRIFEDDRLSGWQFETYAEAYREVTNFMIYYNYRRMHSILLDLSPKEFYQKQDSLVIKEVRV
ncbi:DDE-type integrase/transposase/recombinase [Bacillus sp. EB600]|uniref:DDE-type integrase/transposase/recombinase n=1 Tax=Bacillus sp. EB600 TaxID=2806345 RepID=UPI00210EDDA5|nr:DDE-type integrase/transposase/recombinase [Bacillus sp. EB600]